MNDTNRTSVQEPLDAISEAYSEQIRPYIDVIDNLRRYGLQQDISLPNVVVVGDQSSGKSSIIEAISGIQLPRGKGIVTRCPLELQLKRVTTQPWEAHLSFKTIEGNTENIKIAEPSSVEKKIREAQEKMCGSSKGVSQELITLRVQSPATTAPDLTLIDLPGIARIAMEGQPLDICDQIKRIITNHIEHDNTVILCVVSANLDAAVNESIKIARQYDQHGRRTFGVITKPDIADEANKEDVLGLLNNEKIKLEKGFHMVKCRSQKELEEGLSLEESLQNEKEFFEIDKYYKSANPTQLGTTNLARRITDELFVVIQTNLPIMKDKIATALMESQNKLCALPRGIPDSNQGKLMYLIGEISDMNQEMKASLIYGKSKFCSDSLFYNWRELFNNMRTQMEQIKDREMRGRFTKEKLKDEILRKRGNEISGFLNFELFETLITSHVMLYKAKAEFLHNEMKRHTTHIINQIIHHFFECLPIVESNLKQIAHNQLEIVSTKTSQRIDVLFEEEKLVFTLDTAFEREMDIIKQEEEEKKGMYETQNTPRLKQIFKEDALKKNTKRMLTIINCYLKIVHSRLSDMIPMSIRQCLHVELSRMLKDKFIEYATTSGIEVKISENKSMGEKRKNLQDKIQRLQTAREELATI